MRLFRGFALVAALLLLDSCKTTEDDGDIKDLLISQTDGKRRIYFIEDGLIKTGMCNQPINRIRNDTKTSDIRPLCRDQLSAGVSPEAFKAALIKLFKGAYRASTLSAFEESSLNELIAQIKDEKTVNTGLEAAQQTSEASEVGSVWMQFMPFAAGAAQVNFPIDKEAVVGTPFNSVEVALNGMSEYEIPGQVWPDMVNLFTLTATTQDKSSLCPAFIEVLSVSRMENGKPAPVFGGSVIGGLRFLLAQSLKQITSMRISVFPDVDHKDYKPDGKCVIGITATKIEPLELNYKVYIPDPINMDARDLKMAELMATPEARSWHFLWHGIRNGWTEFSAEERKEIREKLGPEWDIDSGGTGDPSQHGEEFLHMHHQMLKALKSHMGNQMYEAWTAPPAPNDNNFPVPSYKEAKSKEYIDLTYKYLSDEHKLAIDAAHAKSMSLSEYGAWLEEGMHNTMHSTWAHPTQWYTSYSPSMKDIMSQPNNYPAFNHPSNNSLAGTYTSHVNPNFYRLHGYIDARIQTWLEAHGYKTIKDKCDPKDQTCYQWKRTWDGKFPTNIANILKDHDHGIDPKKINTLSEAVYRQVALNSQMIPGKGLKR